MAISYLVYFAAAALLRRFVQPVSPQPLGARYRFNRRTRRWEPRRTTTVGLVSGTPRLSLD